MNNKKTLSSKIKKLIFGIVLIIITSFLTATYIIISKERRDYAQSDSENVVRTLSNNISSDMEKYISMSRLVMTEDNLVTFLRSPSINVDIGMINDARYGIMNILNVTEGVDSVMVFREDMIMVATNRFAYDYNIDYMNGESWKQDIYRGVGAAIVSLDSNNVAKRNDGKAVVTIGRAIYDIDSQQRTGILMMNISTSVFERMLSRLGYENICIIGEDGTYLAGNKDYIKYYDQNIQEKDVQYDEVIINGKKNLLTKCKVYNMPIMIMRVSAYGTAGIPFRMLYVLLFLLIVVIIISIYAIIFVRDNITRPIFELSGSMEENKKSGGLKKINVPVPVSELNMLEDDYNSMIDHVNILFEQLVEKEKTLQRAEMRVLQEQIKPHFLYNSIGTIGYMALDAGADNVHAALETLGSFYRNFLSKGDRVIPLSKEICIVKDYLSLQRLRYGDILQDEYELSDNSLDFMVPKLILQPLVENCIYHGIRPKGEKGRIKITSKIENNELYLSVLDTGVGMRHDEIDRILLTKMKDMHNKESESFGLWGTIERIRYYAGRDDVVNIKSEVGEYTIIEFIIPDVSAIRG